MATLIEEQINILIEVQGLDVQIYRLKEEQEVKPRRLEELRQVCRKREVFLDEQHKKIKSIELHRKEKEIELQSKEEGVKKYQGQLYQVKTNK